jgi:hypothetical protein
MDNLIISADFKKKHFQYQSKCLSKYFGSYEDFESLPFEDKIEIFPIEESNLINIRNILESSKMSNNFNPDRYVANSIPFPRDYFTETKTANDLLTESKDNQSLENWLNELHINADTEIILVPYSNDDAIFTNWKMLVKYCNNFIDGNIFHAFSSNNAWCLSFMSSTLYFGTKRKSDSEFTFFRNP